MAQAHLKPASTVDFDRTAQSTIYWQRALAVLLAATLLRLLVLGRAAWHPDEAIHALSSSNFLDYKFDPIYHGPLLYHLEAFALRIFGDSDFAARLVPALLGIGLVALVLGSARRWLGNNGALWSAALLALSPVMVAYSRRLLHDALVLVLTLGAVLYFQAARENSSKTWEGREARVGCVLMLVLFLATKANAFFVIGMLGAYWLSLWLRPAQSTVDFGGILRALPLALFGIVAGAAVLAVRGGETEKRNEILLLCASLLCCAALWEWLRRARRETAEARSERDFVAPLLAVALGAFVFAFLYGRGFLWLRDGISKESLGDAWNALPRMLKYWRGQQGKPRLPGPHDYYIVLALLYELPIVIAGAFGIVRASRVRTAFTDLLLWWCFTSFAVYALANEKVPWLLTHQILPLALLGGVWLSSLHGERLLARKWLFGLSALGAIFLLRNVVATSFGRAGDQREPLYYAQTTEAFGDTFAAAMDEAVWRAPKANRGVWLQEDRWWPTSWNVRRARREGIPVDFYSKVNPQLFSSQRSFAVMPPEDDAAAGKLGWKTLHRDKFANWRTWNIIKYPPGIEKHADFLVWSRASWRALSPPTFGRWWLTREASLENGSLSEWSHIPAVVATRE